MAERAVAELGGGDNRARSAAPSRTRPAARARPPARRASSCRPTTGRRWPPARPTATRWRRSAPGRDVVALDGEVGNSTYAEEFAKAVSRALLRDVHRRAAAGRGGGRASAVRGYGPFASTFAAFFSRAYDFIRMAAISQADICLAGSHAASRSVPTARRRWRWRTWPAASRPRLDRAVPQRCHRDGRAGRGHGRLRGRLLHADHPGAYPVLYDAGRRSVSAGPRCCAPACETRSRWSARG